jgi:hypothetical protein
MNITEHDRARIPWKYIYSLVLGDVAQSGYWTVRASIVMEWLVANDGLPTQEDLNKELAQIMRVVDAIKGTGGAQ